MARIVKGGILAQVSGKIGDFSVHQQQIGPPTLQKLPEKRTTPFSQAEIDQQKPMKVWNAFLKPIKDFIDIGYEIEARRHKSNPHNVIVIQLCDYALYKDGRNTKVDYSRVLVTKGKMNPPRDITAEVQDAGFMISWDKEIKYDGEHFTDQVMVLAYSTETFEARFINAGAERIEGKHFLAMHGIEKGKVVHIWVAFIQNNRKSISNSVYLGQMQW